jgi:hypothetical protein
MDIKAKLLLTFMVGAAVGSVSTWKYVKNKYEKIAQDEIDSVKETFYRRENDMKGKSAFVTIDGQIQSGQNKPSITEYAARLQKEGYVNYSEVEPEVKDTMNIDLPYVIAPEEFMEYEEYDHISLTYYADGVLTDENEEVIEDVDAIIGIDSLNHFGEYEDDSVYVRNDGRKCDYEILLDQRLYSDVIKQLPSKMED